MGRGKGPKGSFCEQNVLISLEQIIWYCEYLEKVLGKDSTDDCLPETKVAQDGEEGMCKDEVIKVAPVEANDFPKKKAKRSSLDMLQTLQWIGWAMIMEGATNIFGPI